MFNLELKAYCSDPEAIKKALTDLNVSLERTYLETDTYFLTKSSRLKYREGPNRNPRLIAYERSNASALRESRIQLAECQDEDSLLKDVLLENLVVKTVVSKTRSIFRSEKFLINLDFLANRCFVEIEVFDDDKEAAKKTAAFLKNAFKIHDFDIVPWSYENLQLIFDKNTTFKDDILNSDSGLFNNLVFVSDASGKDLNIFAEDLKKNWNCSVVKRISSSLKGAAFIKDTHENILKSSLEGDFCEVVSFSNYSSGISYSFLKKTMLMSDGRPVVAFIDPASISHVKSLFPEVKFVLINASQEALNKNLDYAAFINGFSANQCLDTWRKAQTALKKYDHVLDGDSTSLLEDLMSVFAA